MSGFEFASSQPMKLHPELKQKLDEYDNIRGFNPESFVTSRCQGLLDYLKKHDLHSTVVSVSGGIDSAVILSLLVEAQKMAPPDHPFHTSNGGKVIGIAQPIHSTKEIQTRAYEVALKKGIQLVTIDQSQEHESLVQKIESQIGELNGFSKAQFKSYQRTPTAFLLASHYKGVVVGTGNLDEDGYLYYYCKFGDGAVDVGLIWDLHKNEVFSVGKYLEVPDSILQAPPSADLAQGQTDETEMGVTYDMVRLVYSMLKEQPDEMDRWINHLSSEAREQYMLEKKIIDTIHNNGLHKSDLNPVLIGS